MIMENKDRKKASIEEAMAAAAVAGSAAAFLIQHDYHDHAYDLPPAHINARELVSQQPQPSDPFPVRLHFILEQIEKDGLEHVVAWQPHGRCFLVKRSEEFQLLLPKYFNISKVASFQRQLNLYGFQRITRGIDKAGYYHELFLRGKIFLAHQIIRTRVKGTGVRGRANPEQEPDFWSMEWISRPALNVTTTDIARAYYSSSKKSPKRKPNNKQRSQKKKTTLVQEEPPCGPVPTNDKTPYFSSTSSAVASASPPTPQGGAIGEEDVVDSSSSSIVSDDELDQVLPISFLAPYTSMTDFSFANQHEHSSLLSAMAMQQEVDDHISTADYIAPAPLLLKNPPSHLHAGATTTSSTPGNTIVSRPFLSPPLGASPPPRHQQGPPSPTTQAGQGTTTSTTTTSRKSQQEEPSSSSLCAAAAANVDPLLSTTKNTRVENGGVRYENEDLAVSRQQWGTSFLSALDDILPNDAFAPRRNVLQQQHSEEADNNDERIMATTNSEDQSSRGSPLVVAATVPPFLGFNAPLFTRSPATSTISAAVALPSRNNSFDPISRSYAVPHRTTAFLAPPSLAAAILVPAPVVPSLVHPSSSHYLAQQQQQQEEEEEDPSSSASFKSSTATTTTNPPLVGAAGVTAPRAGQRNNKKDDHAENDDKRREQNGSAKGEQLPSPIDDSALLVARTAVAFSGDQTHERLVQQGLPQPQQQHEQEQQEKSLLALIAEMNQQQHEEILHWQKQQQNQHPPHM